MAPKQKTKGQKEIEKDNVSTVAFWQNVVGITTGLHLLFIALYWYFGVLTFGTFVSFGFCTLVYVLGMWMLQKIASSGLDLTINKGTGGYTKDVVIVTVAAQALSIISNYFMLVWLAVPSYAFYTIWVSFIWPWFQMGSGGGGEGGSDRAKKRQERRQTKRIVRHS